MDRRVILKWILKKHKGGAWNDFAGLRIETRGGAVVNMIMNSQV
jgi:hypothetical protein